MSETMIHPPGSVVAAGEITIVAEPDVVWAVLADIADWPSWNPDVREVSLQGGLAPGTVFRWRASFWTITSTLRRVESPHHLGWTGSMPGVGAVHTYCLEEVPEGTRVYTEESWAGLLPRLFGSPMQRSLREALERGLWYLKAEVERRVTLPARGSTAA
ncbi:MAG: SRPBCC family protein [Chloroflexota bacterium]